MALNGRDRSARASPTKAFFVEMITRDISLEDSILDLIDNSVDSAWRSAGSHPSVLDDNTDLSKFRITITATAERFSISDNCGGMSLYDATEYAFRFGRRVTEEYDKYSIGVYGIGMKRAAFKLGRNVLIRSRFRSDSGDEENFAVPIAVREWLRDDNQNWDFDIVDDEGLEETGVEIVIQDLTSATRVSFGNPAFAQELRRTIARDYLIHLNRGLVVMVNDQPVIALPIALSESTEYAPVRLQYTDEVEGEDVSIEIIGGMASAPPENLEPSDEADYEKRFGWYIACNGRIVLAADKTGVSGWGTSDWPQWHPQYAGFIGIVIFSAANAKALPLTTTKRSVDVSSEVYLRARPRMRDISKKWIAYTNARKQAMDDAKKMEQEASETVVPFQKVEVKPTITLPSLTPRSGQRRANVNYSVSVRRMKKLAQEMGNINMPYRDVGLKSFDYAYSDYVGED